MFRISIEQLGQSTREREISWRVQSHKLRVSEDLYSANETTGNGGMNPGDSKNEDEINSQKYIQ
jgi:hypothetical protein